jgi:outer membrane murein-binding lipoprotein Lpp
MRKAIAIVVTLVALTLAGCKSKQQKQADLSAEYQTANAQYQKDCSAKTSDQDANAIVGGAFGNKPSPQQQSGIDQRQREAEALKSSPHCKELDAKRNDLTKQMLANQ